MQTIQNPIDNAGALKALLVNLYTGWGYNAYRQENKDRADDVLIRNGVCGLLADARAALKERAAQVQRSIPQPSREDPFPGSVQRAQVREIERVGAEVESVETAIRSLPVPQNDSTWIRHRAERDFLPRLAQADEAMAQGALALREAARAGTDLAALQDLMRALRQGIEQRKAILSGGLPV